MKKLAVFLVIVGITIVGCSSGKSPNGTNLVVVKHKKHSANCTALNHKHKNQATIDANIDS